MGSNGCHDVLWAWPHKHDINADSFDDLLSRSRMLRLGGRVWPVRAMLLWYFARRYKVLVLGLAGGTTKGLFAIERLLGCKRRYMVILHFIPETSLPEPTLDLSYAIRMLRIWLLRILVRPVVQRCALGCQQLTDWEVHRNASWFRVPADRMHLIPYPLRTEGDVLAPQSGTGGVMASGRAVCDWPTVFEAARGEDWPLTVVCGKRDLAQVNRLNAAGRATVLTDIPLDAHFDLIAASSVYLLALRRIEVSSGQIRLSDAVRAGTPIVASLTPGIAGYVEDERTALVFSPGDASHAKRQIRRLLDDPGLGSRLSADAFESAERWTRERYRAAIHEMVDVALAEVNQQGAATINARPTPTTT
jgi:hypothetical protein